MQRDLDDWLFFAGGLAASAQRLAAAPPGALEVTIKADGSEVTHSDLQIQRLYAERIHERFPDHAVLGEETTALPSGIPAPSVARFCWVFDPLDGTRNYVRGLPSYCTSLALLDRGRPIIGVIRHLVTGFTYRASRGGGAFAGRRPMTVATSAFGRDSVMTFQPADDGSTYDLASNWPRRVHIRNTGSTALHLAMLAAGNVDGAVCIKCHSWDVAAGVLMVEEAGGRVTDLTGQAIVPFDMTTNLRRLTPFVAGSAPVHAALLAGVLPSD